jgi:4-hydroxy-4-methyl-2-oxoglutarate aldolase
MIPVFYCAGETARAGTAELMPDAANVPAVLAGVTVVPGDYVCADSTGTVIIPARHFDEVWAAATEIETNEVAQRLSIRKKSGGRERGKPRTPKLAALLAR